MQMTDRELLELAAKSIGLFYVWRPYGGHVESTSTGPVPWNSLQSNADAFSLMVELGMDIEQNHPGFVVIRIPRMQFSMEEIVRSIDDYLPATRRAITRAAAEIQLAKEQPCKN